MKLYIYKSGNEFYLNYYYQTQSSSLSNLINIYIYDSSYMNENLFFLFSFSFSTKSTISAAPSNPPACSRIEKIARDYFAALLNFKVEFFFLSFSLSYSFPSNPRTTGRLSAVTQRSGRNSRTSRERPACPGNGDRFLFKVLPDNSLNQRGIET